MSSPDPRPDRPGRSPDFEPEDVRYIGDVETLRAISDATRMRILETMVQRRSPAWSVKELAAALEMPQTRLYHHVELLLERDLIRPTERRVVSGIIETRYSVAALSFQLDRSLFAATRGPPRSSTRRSSPCSTPRAQRWSSPPPRHHHWPTRPASATSSSPAASPASPRTVPRAPRRLQALLEEFGDDDADGVPFGVVLALYPMPPTDEEPSDG